MQIVKRARGDPHLDDGAAVFILAVADFRELPQRVERPAVVGGDRERHKLLLAAEALLHRFLERVQSLSGFGGNEQGLRVLFAQNRQQGRVLDRIDLVEDQQRLLFCNAQFRKHLPDRRHLLFGLRAGSIDDVQQQVGMDGFFQSGAERGDQVVWQPADETDRVGQQHEPSAAKRPAPGKRIQRRKEEISRRRLRIGKGVHEGTLTGVGVPDQRNGKEVLPRLDLADLSTVDLGNLAFKQGDAVGDQSAVDFDLAFPRAARSDAAHDASSGCAAGTGDAFQVRPHPAKPRGGVLELGQLNLQACRPAARTPGEDVQNQLTAIENLSPRGLFDLADLRRGKVVVKDDYVRLAGLGPLTDFFQFAAAHAGTGVICCSALHHLSHHQGPRGPGQLRQFRKWIFSPALLPYQHRHQQCPFLMDRQIVARHQRHWSSPAQCLLVTRHSRLNGLSFTFLRSGL